MMSKLGFEVLLKFGNFFNVDTPVDSDVALEILC
jgi:hypothetical protein